MKKRNIIAAVAATMMMSVGVANAATAAVLDLDAKTGTLDYASQATVLAAGTVVTIAGATTGQLNNMKVGVGLGANVTGQLFIRVDLSGTATFNTAITSASLGINAIAGETTTLKLGGSAGANFAIFQVDSAAAAIATTSVAAFKMVDVKVKDQAAVSLTMASYATLTAANAKTSPLKTATSNKLVFVSGHSVSTGTVSAGKIDVATGSKKFVATANVNSTTVNPIVNPTIGKAASPAVVFAINDGLDTVLGADLAGAYTLTVNGDFASTQNLTGTTPNGTYTAGKVWINNTADCTTVSARIGVTNTSLAAGKAVFTMTGITSLLAANTICMTANGQTVITNTPFTVDFANTAVTGYTVAAKTGLTGSTFAKNGTTRTVLNIPSSTVAASKKAFIRINNTSGQAGVVRGTLYDQAGTVLLNNVVIAASLASHSTFVLGAGNATGAAGALEALGAAAWTGRAVLVIDSETPSMEVQGLVSNLGTAGVQTNLSGSTK